MKIIQILNEASSGKSTFNDFVKVVKDLDFKPLKSSLDTETKNFAVEQGIKSFNAKGNNTAFGYGSANRISSASADALTDMKNAMSGGIKFPKEASDFVKALEVVAANSKFMTQYLELVSSVTTYCYLINNASTNKASTERFEIAKAAKAKFGIKDTKK